MTEQTNSPKRLYRSHVDRYFVGVCGGLAEYFSMDAMLVRILFVIGALMGGFTIILYIAAIVLLPEDTRSNNEKALPDVQRTQGNMFWGILLLSLGVVLLLRQLGLLRHFYLGDIPWTSIWALFLIFIGLALVFAQRRPSDAAAGEGGFPDIYRSLSERKISGVCGGIALYYGLEPSLVRLVWVVTALASGGVAILAYLACMVILPEEGTALPG